MFRHRYHTLLRNILVANSKTAAGGSAAQISLSAAQYGNYYHALGIPPTSTQNDIKTAYYKLSMQYHPDKNQGCEISAQKFREITRAYEVLSNYRLRRLYDKGIIHTAGTRYGRAVDIEDIEPEAEVELEDDPETKFYKSRFRKSTVADASGRTPIYDFDEWSRAHYGKQFQRRQAARNKYERTEVLKHDLKMSAQNEFLIFGLVFLSFVMYGIFWAETSYDQPKTTATTTATTITTTTPTNGKEN